MKRNNNVCRWFMVMVMVCLVSPAAGQEQKRSKPTEPVPPPGMETVQITAGYKIIVPKGTRVTKAGEAMVIENFDQFVSRRFMETDEKIAQLQAQVASLEKEVAALQQALGLSRSPGSGEERDPEKVPGTTEN